MKFSPVYWIISSVVVLSGAGMGMLGVAMIKNSGNEVENSITESFTGIENLRVESDSCTLTLKSSEDAESCTVEFISATGNPEMYKDGTTLWVKQKKKYQFRLISFGDWEKKGKLIITVPKESFKEIYVSLGFSDKNVISGISCQNLFLDCGVGTLELNDIRTTGVFNIDGGTGDIHMDEITTGGICELDLGVGDLVAERSVMADTSDFDFGTGDSIFENCDFGEVDLSSGVGDLIMEDVTFAGDVRIKQGTGDVSVDIADRSDDFSVNVKKGMGDVTINGEKNSSLINRDAKYSITVESGVGSIDISFADEQ